MKKEISKVITEVREKVPLVHAITNYVTINDCANILLAYGASPAMVEAYDETFDFTKISNALYLNIGTLTKEQEASTIMAAISAKMNKVPVVLDPVACGALKRKTDVINRVAELGNIDVIKGNAGEIKFLAGLNADVRGVDSIDNGEGLAEACRSVAEKYSCVVAATGVQDVITDGTRIAFIDNGTKMFTKITGAGCMLGALCAGTAGACEDKFISTCAAIAAMNIAGEKAFAEAKAPGSFRVKLIDSIYELTEEEIEREIKISFN